MPVPEAVKNTWIELQKQCSYPVNAIGVRINSNDEKTLKVWREEGIDQYLKEEASAESD